MQWEGSVFYLHLIVMYYSSFSSLQCPIIQNTAYYDTRSISQLYKVLEIYTGYFDSLDIVILVLLSQQYRNNERLLYVCEVRSVSCTCTQLSFVNP